MRLMNDFSPKNLGSSARSLAFLLLSTANPQRDCKTNRSKAINRSEMPSPRRPKKWLIRWLLGEESSNPFHFFGRLSSQYRSNRWKNPRRRFHDRFWEDFYLKIYNSIVYFSFFFLKNFDGIAPFIPKIFLESLFYSEKFIGVVKSPPGFFKNFHFLTRKQVKKYKFLSWRGYVDAFFASVAWGLRTFLS